MSAHPTYYRRMSRLLMAAPIHDDEKLSATAWYEEAGQYAREIARYLDTTHEVGACILAAFSPRQTWERNVDNAFHYALGHEVPGLRVWTVMADAAIVQGFDALRGPKTNAFARAIAGDPDAVVIDVWMMRAAGLDPSNGPTATQYAEVSAAVRALARRHDMSPRDMQALIWKRVRGAWN